MRKSVFRSGLSSIRSWFPNSSDDSCKLAAVRKSPCISPSIWKEISRVSRLIPRRIGFLTEGELEFFELFCTVDKIGVKKALKLLARPIKEIADAVQRQDSKWLTTLPGVGKQSAEQIIATLRTKVTKFALMSPARESVAGEPASPAAVDTVIFEDAYSALLVMGLSPLDARTLLDQVIASGKKCNSVQDVISAAFKKGGD